MDSVKKQKIGFLIGKDPQTGEPVEIPLGVVPDEELEKLAQMSDEAKKNYFKELYFKLPEPVRRWAGFCNDINKHVTHRECRLCGTHTKKYKTLEQLEACKQQYIK
jgi:hypothetical protein